MAAPNPSQLRAGAILFACVAAFFAVGWFFIDGAVVRPAFAVFAGVAAVRAGWYVVHYRRTR